MFDFIICRVICSYMMKWSNLLRVFIVCWPLGRAKSRAIESGLGSSSSESRSTMGGGSPLRIAEDHTRGGLEGGRNWGRRSRAPHVFHVRSGDFLSTLFIPFYLFSSPPPSLFYLFFYFGRKRKCWVSFSFFFFLSSAFFFKERKKHISPYLECASEEVPYLRVVLSPAGGILALSPLQYK